MKVSIGKYRKNRKISVTIDDYDLWNLDHTLSLIILPSLIKYKNDNFYFTVEDEDLPEEFKLNDTIEKYSLEYDEWFLKRSNYILNEMIWSFTEIVNERSGEENFHSGVVDYIHVPCDSNGDTVDEKDAKFFRLDKGPNDTSSFDKEGYLEYSNRIQNGCKLFGKYFQGLWT